MRISYTAAQDWRRCPEGLTEADIAWLAGFFDGEGCIFAVASANRDRNYAVVVTLVQKDPTPLHWVAQHFGGWVNSARGIYGWRASNRLAGRFLSVVTPYLRVKREQAELALAFQLGQQANNHRLTEARREEGRSLYLRLRAMKTRRV